MGNHSFQQKLYEFPSRSHHLFSVKKSIFTIFFIIFSSTAFCADEPNKIEKVVVTGIGINADKTHQNAI